ncbi:putative cytosine deaminase protein [Eutypa lata UCREL1]|uniref:Putative cytosine deaminase protein n=1 Tax=Eutypa lata (strain UCR-EL1) TaxID=1287681 RepID=M7T669_EUTLA|nr:putative cytosine deaminase protein [Eutypa lata UCREL1]
MDDEKGLALALEEATIGYQEGGIPGETFCLQNAGRLPSSAYKGSSTGACLLYGISRVVIGENKTFLGGETYLRQRGVEVVVVDSAECRDLMEKFIGEKPEVWNEDIGVEERVYSKEGIKGAP